VSKERRVDPIVGMGLFMNSNGLRINMFIFPGNTSESLTLWPIMEDVKKSYSLGSLVVVAGKGLNSSKNIEDIVNHGDGYYARSNSGVRRGSATKKRYLTRADTYGASFYDIYSRQEAFNKFLKNIRVA
jgi:transposase